MIRPATNVSLARRQIYLLPGDKYIYGPATNIFVAGQHIYLSSGYTGDKYICGMATNIFVAGTQNDLLGESVHMSIHTSIHMPIHMPMHMPVHTPIQGSIYMSTETSLWCMDWRVCVDSREACRSDPGGYDFFSGIGS